MPRPKKRSDGTGSVFQRGDGRWVAQVRVWDEHAGTSKQVRRYASSRDAARDLLAQLRAAGDAPTRRPETLTVVDYLQSWSDTTLPVSGRAPATVRQYRDLIRSPLKPTLGKVRLSRFTPAEAERWLGRLDKHRKRNGEPLSASTKRNTFAVLSAALATAVRDGLIREHPLRDVTRPRHQQVQVPVLSATQVETLLAAAKGQRIEPLLTFVAMTGVRLGEALSLRWVDVDLDAATARIVRGSLDRKSTKTGAKRAVPLVPDVVDQLRAQKVWQAEHRLLMGKGWADRQGLVFTTAIGTPVDPHNARRDLRVLLVAAGLPTDRPWHTLRHSLATRLLNRGTPMPVVSAILGHASIRTTVDCYGHAEPAISAAALAAAMAQ
jgi:integrase